MPCGLPPAQQWFGHPAHTALTVQVVVCTPALPVVMEIIAIPLAIDKPKKFVKISPVAVESNVLRPLNSTLALGFYSRVSTEGRAKWLFLLSFHGIRTPHDSSEFEWTAWKKTPHTSTPLVQNVTSVDLATGKAHSTSVVNKAVCISEQIRQAHLGLFLFFFDRS